MVNLSVVIKITIIVAALVYIFWDINLLLLKEALKRYELTGILITQFVLSISFLFVAYRLRYLTKMKISTKAALEATMFGLGINNILPAKLGEIAKGFYLNRFYGLSLSKSLTLIIIERIFDVFMLFLFALMLSYFFEVANLFTLFIIILVAITCLVIIINKAELFLKIIFLYAPKAGRKFLSTSLKTVARVSLKEWNILFWFSLFIWFYYLLCIYFFNIFCAKLDLPLQAYLAAFVFSSLAMALPATPGSIGVYEAGFIFGFGLFGISKEDAFIFGFIVHLFQIIPTTIYALFLISSKQISIKSIKQK